MLRELDGDQRRQLIDTQQLYEAYQAAALENRRRFAGSMRWAERRGNHYLLRKVGKTETSLGPRSETTQTAYAAFTAGREKNQDLLTGLSSRLDRLAPVNRAMGLARLPRIAARILRRCSEKTLLGRQLLVVGTNALYAYEAKAGVQFDSGLVATADIDLLYDARRRLSLAMAGPLRADGLMGLLRQVDKSFVPVASGAFRATNRDGYLVDLIRPQARDAIRDRAPSALTAAPGDLEGAPIEGLVWLVNAPRLEAIAIDERGYPASLVTIDPRVFALHKAWLSTRRDRDPLKAKRDLAQAKAAALLATRYLRLSFESPDLSELPASLRQLSEAIVEVELPATTRDITPNW